MATQTIRTALDRIKTVEEGLGITSGVDGPETLTIKRVYKLTPKQDAALETPCFIHGVTLGPTEHGANGIRRQTYFVRCQFYHLNADLDRAQDIAAAFLAKWADAFSADLRLNGAVSGPISWRGSDPTIARLEWAGLSYIGFEVLMAVPMAEAVTVGM